MIDIDLIIQSIETKIKTLEKLKFDDEPKHFLYTPITAVTITSSTNFHQLECQKIVNHDKEDEQICKNNNRNVSSDSLNESISAHENLDSKTERETETGTRFSKSYTEFLNTLNEDMKKFKEQQKKNQSCENFLGKDAEILKERFEHVSKISELASTNQDSKNLLEKPKAFKSSAEIPTSSSQQNSQIIHKPVEKTFKKLSMQRMTLNSGSNNQNFSKITPMTGNLNFQNIGLKKIIQNQNQKKGNEHVNVQQQKDTFKVPPVAAKTSFIIPRRNSMGYSRKQKCLKVHKSDKLDVEAFLDKNMRLSKSENFVRDENPISKDEISNKNPKVIKSMSKSANEQSPKGKSYLDEFKANLNIIQKIELDSLNSSKSSDTKKNKSSNIPKIKVRTVNSSKELLIPKGTSKSLLIANSLNPEKVLNNSKFDDSNLYSSGKILSTSEIKSEDLQTLAVLRNVSKLSPKSENIVEGLIKNSPKLSDLEKNDSKSPSFDEESKQKPEILVNTSNSTGKTLSNLIENPLIESAKISNKIKFPKPYYLKIQRIKESETNSSRFIKSPSLERETIKVTKSSTNSSLILVGHNKTSRKSLDSLQNNIPRKMRVITTESRNLSTEIKADEKEISVEGIKSYDDCEETNTLIDKNEANNATSTLKLEDSTKNVKSQTLIITMAPNGSADNFKTKTANKTTTTKNSKEVLISEKSPAKNLLKNKTSIDSITVDSASKSEQKFEKHLEKSHSNSILDSQSTESEQDTNTDSLSLRLGKRKRQINPKYSESEYLLKNTSREFTNAIRSKMAVNKIHKQDVTKTSEVARKDLTVKLEKNDRNSILVVKPEPMDMEELSSSSSFTDHALKINPRNKSTNFYLKFEPSTSKHSNFSSHGNITSKLLEPSDFDTISSSQPYNHPGSNEIKCKLCPKTFTNYHSLERHKSLHSDNRRYNCTKCNYKFIQKSDLTRHMVIHDGAPNLECSKCNRKFRTKKKLSKHLDNHHEAKSLPFKCGKCDMRVKNENILRYHVMTHHSGIKYECGYCGKDFSMKEYLESHIKTHMLDENYLETLNDEDFEEELELLEEFGGKSDAEDYFENVIEDVMDDNERN